MMVYPSTGKIAYTWKIEMITLPTLQRGTTPFTLLPRDASAERGYEIACRPSVCP